MAGQGTVCSSATGDAPANSGPAVPGVREGQADGGPGDRQTGARQGFA